MKEEPIVAINRIIMYVWFTFGLLALIFSIYDYFIEEELIASRIGISNNTAFGASLFCFVMFGWKKFQMNKFGSQGNS